MGMELHYFLTWVYTSWTVKNMICTNHPPILCQLGTCDSWSLPLLDNTPCGVVLSTQPSNLSLLSTGASEFTAVLPAIDSISSYSSEWCLLTGRDERWVLIYTDITTIANTMTPAMTIPTIAPVDIGVLPPDPPADCGVLAANAQSASIYTVSQWSHTIRRRTRARTCAHCITKSIYLSELTSSFAIRCVHGFNERSSGTSKADETGTSNPMPRVASSRNRTSTAMTLISKRHFANSKSGNVGVADHCKAKGSFWQLLSQFPIP